MEALQARVRIILPENETYNQETGEAITGAAVLKQMKINNVWRNDAKGRYAATMYDGQTFKFREGEITIVPVTVARHLRRMSAIVVGPDKLNGPLMPYLEIVDTYDMTQPQKVTVEVPAKTTPTTCMICGKDQLTFPALMRHQMSEHADQFEEKKASKKSAATQWDAPESEE
jgi:hypothetical protein